jgi:hypothetical protein
LDLKREDPATMTFAPALEAIEIVSSSKPPSLTQIRENQILPT